jgi:predicted SAM-dependent methyltransferase
MTQAKVNLECGTVFVTGDDWLNFDYGSSGPAVQAADLLSKLTLERNSVTLVYSSHFLEHITRTQVPAFLSECWRILQPGSVWRSVVPDLENLCRICLDHRDRGDHAMADFVVLELLDQCVRSESGGDLGRYYHQLRSAPQANAEPIAFVRQRTGEELITPHPPPSVD